MPRREWYIRELRYDRILPAVASIQTACVEVNLITFTLNLEISLADDSQLKSLNDMGVRKVMSNEPGGITDRFRIVHGHHAIALEPMLEVLRTFSVSSIYCRFCQRG